MPTKQVREFDRKLGKLFLDRTHWLKSLIRKKAAGKAPQFDKKKVDREVVLLQASATDALLHSKLIPAFGTLYTQKKQWHPKKGKGWGVRAKTKNFRAWYRDAISSQHCVYIFWNKKRCLYIGRTLNGHGRPSSHFQRFWFSNVTRIDILAAKSKRKVPMLECLVTHRYQPQHSQIKPSTKKWFSRCPICEVNKSIRSEVKTIFRLG